MQEILNMYQRLNWLFKKRYLVLISISASFLLSASCLLLLSTVDCIFSLRSLRQRGTSQRTFSANELYIKHSLDHADSEYTGDCKGAEFIDIKQAYRLSTVLVVQIKHTKALSYFFETF